MGFDRIGLFDEELVRHQDDELNLRLIRGGGKIFMTPKIRSRYYPRSTLRKLWRQYYQYGFWRIKTMQMYGRPAVLRQSIPLLFVSSLGLLGLVGIFWKVAWWLLGAEFALYVLGLLYGVYDVSSKAGWKYALPAPLVFRILHFAYGIGGLWRIIRFVVLRGWKMKRVDEFKLSR